MTAKGKALDHLEAAAGFLSACMGLEELSPNEQFGMITHARDHVIAARDVLRHIENGAMTQVVGTNGHYGLSPKGTTPRGAPKH